jgi:hypothetical protein
MEKSRGAYRVLLGKPEGRRPFEWSKRRWKNTIKIGLTEVGWGRGMNWIDLSQNRDRCRALVHAVMNLGVS